MPLFIDQYKKVIEAYYEDKIQPMNSEFCFCGTLHGGRGWKGNGDEFYTAEDYGRLESALLTRISFENCRWLSLPLLTLEERGVKPPNLEDQLFDGMSAALDVLREIHINKGEDIDSQFSPLIKRKQSTRNNQ